MSILDQIKRDADKKAGGTFLKLEDKEQVRVRFLQEFAKDRPGYDEKAGTANYLQVHSSPKDFKKSAICTLDSDGDCYACEQVDAPGKDMWKWKPKGKFYVNVLVTKSDGSQSVQVLQQGLSDKHVVKFLMELDEEYGSITDRDYKLKRTGADMNSTAYTLTPLEKSPLTIPFDDLHDLSKVAKRVAPEDQEAFYNGTDDEESADKGW